MLSDATRVRLLWALAGGEMPVNDLAEQVEKSPAAVSQHLARLRMARLVQTRREGTQVFYRLENEHVRRLLTDAVFNAEHAGPGIPGHHLADPALAVLRSATEAPPAQDSPGATESSTGEGRRVGSVEHA